MFLTEQSNRVIPREDKNFMNDDHIWSYIAGFLDGDGCIMLQLVYRKDYIYGYQIRASIVFYQHKVQIKFLHWLEDQFKCGYIRERNDNMAEYTIVGYKAVAKVLQILQPYVKLKKEQIVLALQIINMVHGGPNSNPKKFLEACKLMDQFAKLNYSKKRTRYSKEVEQFMIEHKILSP